MRITFCGAAGEVTGSQHLLDLGGHRILLDCGLHQGRHQDMSERNGKFQFDPASIEAVIVSHAHLDHVGLLPVLIKNGYRGKIFSTGATRDLAEQILLDAAKLQQQEADYANRHKLDEAPFVQPLYGQDHIPPVMDRWERLPYMHDDPRWQSVVPGVEVKLYDAGHILGSAVTVVQSGGERIAFTGDLGRWGAPLLRDPQTITDEVNTLISEATYGDRLHHPIASVHQQLVDIVKATVAQQGKIIVPAFSLGRTQELVYILHQLTDRGMIPRLPIYVDSPLASRITEVFEQHQRDYDQQSHTDFTELGEDPLIFRNLQYTGSVEESKSLNLKPGPMMIISASGMANGGRVMHHLKNNLSDAKNTILFTGYQAAHTDGRALVEGAKHLRLFGQTVPVAASIAIVNDLSAHADANELEQYAASIPGLQNVFLVHAEPDRAQQLQQRLQQHHVDWHVEIPHLGQVVELARASDAPSR